MIAAVSTDTERHQARIPVLDGVRGSAVLAIMLFHFSSMLPGTSALFRTYTEIFRNGWVGVDLFFVLSGFLITGILVDSRTSNRYFLTFYVRRALRIFPLYYVSVSMFLLVFPALLVMLQMPERAVQITKVAQFPVWTYTLNWTTGINGWGAATPVTGHFWSLCIEEQFYLVWPVFIRVLPRRQLMIVSLCLVVVAPLLRIVSDTLHVPLGAYTFPFCRMDALAIGAILALVWRNQQLWTIFRRFSPYAALLFGVGAVWGLVGASAFIQPLRSSLIGLFFGSAVLIALSAQSTAITARVLSSSTLRFFGKYSYCLYVWHPFVLFVMPGFGLSVAKLSTRFHGANVAGLIIGCAYFVTTISIALLSWKCLERPFLFLKDRFEYCTSVGGQKCTEVQCAG